MRHRWMTLALTIASFARLDLRRCGSSQQQFFPASDRPELLVDLTLPQDASIARDDGSRWTGSRSCWPAIRDIDRWSTYVGQGAIRFYLPLDVQCRT